MTITIVPSGTNPQPNLRKKGNSRTVRPTRTPSIGGEPGIGMGPLVGSGAKPGKGTGADVGMDDASGVGKTSGSERPPKRSVNEKLNPRRIKSSPAPTTTVIRTPKGDRPVHEPCGRNSGRTFSGSAVNDGFSAASAAAGVVGLALVRLHAVAPANSRASMTAGYLGERSNILHLAPATQASAVREPFPDRIRTESKLRN